MYDYNPYEPFSQEMGNITLMLRKSKLQYKLSSWFPIQETTRQRRFFRLYGRPYVEIGIVKDLKFKTQMSMNYERYKESLYKTKLFLGFNCRSCS
jgi:hypothetical protein